MMMLLLLVVLILIPAITTDGAESFLRAFSDPKDVELKTSSCATTAQSCEPPDIDLMAEQGFLQSKDGEDRCLIEYYFPGICVGTYLDVGAFDGIQNSNTYALHKVMGWRGVNVEIDSDNFEKLARNRRDDIANVHAAVCSDRHVVHYAIAKENKAAGGIWEFADDVHRGKWWKDTELYHTIPMKCTPLKTVLDRTVGTAKFHFDLATIDLKGVGELSALLGIDFDVITFGVIIVQKSNNGDANQKVSDLLHAEGYTDSRIATCGVGRTSL